MFPFFETIKIIDGIPQNLEYHSARMHNTLMKFYCSSSLHSLENMINVPQIFSTGIVKCKIAYSDNDYNATYNFYLPRNINTLKLVKCDSIDYSYKYSNRDKLDELLLLKGDCDDILIVKNGMITDTSFTNIAFLSKSVWYTPSFPLLKGTARIRLIEAGQIIEKEMTINNLGEFESFILINSMLDMNFSNARPMKSIIH